METTVTMSLKDYSQYDRDRKELFEFMTINKDERHVIVYTDFGHRYLIKNNTEADGILKSNMDRLLVKYNNLSEELSEAKGELRRMKLTHKPKKKWSLWR